MFLVIGIFYCSKLEKQLLLRFMNYLNIFICSLAEYTPENPKITTKCSHHFHLGCIYEWLERSESCPICGKVCAE